MEPEPAAAVCGLVLAAGAGTRFGGPKGLARDAAGAPWVQRAVETLRAGGCGRVLVAVGARGDEVAALVPAGAELVRVADWADGLSATLRAGLAAAVGDVGMSSVGGRACDAVVVLPVDVPDAPAAAVRRIIDAAGRTPRGALVQAAYGGSARHPVLLGAGHLAAVAASVTGDDGARAYLRAHDVTLVECADLWHGDDVDRR